MKMLIMRRIIAVCYLVLLSCNFLYVPWRARVVSVDSATILLDGWLWQGGRPTEHEVWNEAGRYREILPCSSDCEGLVNATPDLPRILLRTLAVLVFAPLVLGPFARQGALPKFLSTLRHVAKPSASTSSSSAEQHAS